jgi:hypothetical protein
MKCPLIGHFILWVRRSPQGVAIPALVERRLNRRSSEIRAERG